jgi:hypothetical protein
LNAEFGVSGCSPVAGWRLGRETGRVEAQRQSCEATRRYLAHQMAGDPPGHPMSQPGPGAIGNAIAHAVGVRVRDLPLTRERAARAIEDS